MLQRGEAIRQPSPNNTTQSSGQASHTLTMLAMRKDSSGSMDVLPIMFLVLRSNCAIRSRQPSLIYGRRVSRQG